MELDESSREAAARELEEETGVKLNPEDLEIVDSVHLVHPDGKQIVADVFEAEIKGEPDLEADGEVLEAAFKKRFDEESPLLDSISDHIPEARD